MPPAAFVTVPLLAAEQDLVHGFERRTPGAPAETRSAARARSAAALADRGRVLFLNQVHGASVVQAPWNEPPQADAAVATTAGLLLAIETADCLPILLVDPTRRAAAAAHAGWRGTAAGVAGAAVRALTASGSRAADLLVALGPAIGACCYEVGDDVCAALAPAAAAWWRRGPRGRPHLDLRAANRAQLLAAGVGAEHIADVDECTRCRPDYHSWRRDGAAAGRMIHVVGYAASASRR